MHNKQGYSNINLLLGACKVIYMLNEIKVKMRKNSIVFKLAETFCHRWPSYWKLAQLLVWQCSFLHNLPSHAWNDGLKLLSVLQRTWASCYGKKEEATSLSGAWGCYSTSASLQTIPSKEGTHQGLLSQNCSFPPHPLIRESPGLCLCLFCNQVPISNYFRCISKFFYAAPKRNSFLVKSNSKGQNRIS